MPGLLGDTVPSETPPTVAPSYGDIFRQMLGMAVGGPISTLNYAARGLTGDLLFPMERTTRYRNYLQQQQQLPGTDVVPVNQQRSQASAPPIAQAGAAQSGPGDILRYLGGFVAPNLTSLMSGQGPPPVANFPAEPGKVPPVDPRMMGAGFELPGLVPGPGEVAGLGVAGAKALGAAAPAALRFWAHEAGPETARLMGLVGAGEAPGAAAVRSVGHEAPAGGGVYPGIYKDPRDIAAEAAAQVAPEHPALKELFGVNRQDLYDISQQGRRPGNMEPSIAAVANPRGSATAAGVMNPANAQRILDAMTEAQKYPELVKGMDPWYVMDPAYQRMVELVGPDQAKKDYVRFNTLGSMASPASDVMTEINRGTAANMMAARGQFPLFQQYGGMAAANRGADFPEALRDVIGHPYHSTSQAGPMGRYLESGKVEMSQPKVPLYIQASGVPETGFQTKLPVPDAHFTRAIGMADVRQNANPGVSMKTPEYAQVGPWWRQQIADPLGIQAVPAQARAWGLFSPQTGVDTPIGAPKLELLAQRIWERAQKLGVDPKVLRDQVLRGGAHAMLAAGIVGPGLMRQGDEQ